MRLLVILLIAAGIFGLRTFPPSYMEAQASAPRPRAWTITEDRLSGPILQYSKEDGAQIARIDCVGPGPALPLLDMSRPFNLRLSLRSERMAQAWLHGREVVLMMEDVHGWHKVDVIALLDNLMISPRETERGLVALMENGFLRLKIMGNLAGEGIFEEDILISDEGFDLHAAAQIEGCERVGH